VRLRTAIVTKVEEPSATRVLVPYTKATEKLQAVVDCLRIQFIQPELVRVGADDSYWRMLRDAWQDGREFFVVEQDVMVWPGSIVTLSSCPQDWCTLPTLCHGRIITTTFGCVKFSARMIERNPGIWDRIDRTWCYLDAHLSEDMGWPFIMPHAHYPAAAHLNEVQWPDSISRRFPAEKLAWHSMEKGGEPVAWWVNAEDKQWQEF
jgi:hypothetical protein